MKMARIDKIYEIIFNKSGCYYRLLEELNKIRKSKQKVFSFHHSLNEENESPFSFGKSKDTPKPQSREKY
jgi:hypothetical protein